MSTLNTVLLQRCGFYSLVTLACLASGAPLHAEEAQLSTVETRASSLQTLNRPGYQFFSRTDLERRFANLSEFLSQINGIQVQQLSGLGNPALISIRGATAQQTKVLINGIENADAQNGGYDLNQLPISQIDSIEISQDGSSNGYADRAIGGTINIITRKTKSNSQFGIQAGSYGTYRASLSQQTARNINIQLEHEQSDNNYLYPVASPAFDSQNRNNKEALNNAGFSRQSVQVNSGSEELTARLRLSQQKKNIPDYYRNHPDNSAYLSERNAVLELNGEQSLSSMQQQWRIGHSQRFENFRNTLGLIGLSQNDNRYRYEKNYLSASNKKTWTQWQHRIDLKFSEETYRSDYRLDNDSKRCLTPQGNCDAFSFQRSTSIGSQFNWNSKSQQQQAYIDIYRQNTSDISRQRYAISDERTQSNAFIGAAIGYLWYSDRSDWSLTWKRAARTPTLYERYGNHGLFLSNPELQQEISNTLTLNSLWHITEKMQISGSAFYRDLDNAIVPVYDARGIGRYENTSQAILTGIEWNAAYCADYWFGTLSGSHYDSLTTSEIRSFDEKKLPGTYHTSLKASTGFNISKHHIESSVEYSDDLYIDRSNLIEGEARALINLSYRYQATDHEAGLRIINISNNRFLDFTNRPTTGREWLIFLNTRF